MELYRNAVYKIYLRLTIFTKQLYHNDLNIGLTIVTIAEWVHILLIQGYIVLALGKGIVFNTRLIAYYHSAKYCVFLRRLHPRRVTEELRH